MPYPKYELPSWYKPDYHYLEEQISRNERRVKRIEENPDPTKLKANKLMYQIAIKELNDRLEAWKAGEPFVYSMGGAPVSAMGVRAVSPSGDSDRNAAYAADFYQSARGAGFPDLVCDRFQVSAGMWRAGALPPPSFICGASPTCNIEMEMMVAAASDFLGCPNYIIDRYIEPTGEPLEYLVEQVRIVSRELKRAIPEANELNEDELWHYMEGNKEVKMHMNVLWEAAKQVPCPVKGQDVFRIGGPNVDRYPEAIEYYRERTAELEERVRTGFSAVGEEKARCMWLVTGPYFEDAMSILESRGVAIPVFEWDMLQKTFNYGEGVLGDTTEYGRELSPLEEYARQTHMDCWGTQVTEWVDDAMENIKEFKIDMLVYYMLSGCPTNCLAGRIVAEVAEKEFGVPTLLLDGYMMDQERYNVEDVHAKLNEFVDLVFARKGIK